MKRFSNSLKMDGMIGEELSVVKCCSGFLLFPRARACFPEINESTRIAPPERTNCHEDPVVEDIKIPGYNVVGLMEVEGRTRGGGRERERERGVKKAGGRDIVSFNNRTH